MESSGKENPLKFALRRSRATFFSVGLFSCAINILMLTGPLFMLQVYDRVLASRSVPTLVALFGLVVILYLFLGLFDFIRSRALSRAGYRLDVDLGGITQKHWLVSKTIIGQGQQRPVNDLSALRQFLSSNALPALFDLPWVPIYLAIVALLHPWLGWLAVTGAVIVIGVTLANEWLTNSKIGQATASEVVEQNFSESAGRGAESIVALGMTQRVTQEWQRLRHEALGNWQSAGSASEVAHSLTKSTRMLMQSGILALGAYLAIHQEISPGTMIAASILAGRALAPVDLAIGNWKNFVRARQSYGRLNRILPSNLASSDATELEPPIGKISFKDVVKFGGQQTGSAAEQAPILQAIKFDLEPGDGLGVIGPSGCGKSSLGRLLTGIWMPDKGSVRIDGATYDQWDSDAVGKFVGYLPQSIELLVGTIKQNIARFDPQVSDQDVIDAAKLAGVHELILGFPKGYDTKIGDGTHVLSGGQVQRIALARTVLRNPPLVVLDEPNANLDAEGDAALAEAIVKLRKRGSTVIVMAHRPSAIAAVNKVLMLRQGQQLDFGPKEEVLQRVTKQPPNLTIAK